MITHDVPGPAEARVRLDRLPATAAVWRLVFLLSLGGWFELYDLLFIGYVAPGLARSGILTLTTQSFFGFTGVGALIAATFGGLFIGTFCLGVLADRYGRRFIFTYALLSYSVATVIMACQTTAAGLLAWRFVAGIGVGLEMITIDTYVAELVPSHVRGRAFAFNYAVMFTAVPVAAVLAWLLVPHAPFGIAGWRWVMLIGAAGAIVVWFVRRAVPESPVWLAQHGESARAEAILAAIEQRVATESGKPLPSIPPIRPAPIEPKAVDRVLAPRHRVRLLMLMVFNLTQAIGFYGFGNWAPTLLLAKGIMVTKGLAYAALIAVANPVGPLLAMSFADRIGRKWVITGSALAVAVAGLVFAQQVWAAPLIACGVIITAANTTMSYAFHAYQVELFPTAIRARASGIAYSMSRLAAMFSGFIIAYALRTFGVSGALGLIAACMCVAALAIACFGPSDRTIAAEEGGVDRHPEREHAVP